MKTRGKPSIPYRRYVGLLIGSLVIASILIEGDRFHVRRTLFWVVIGTVLVTVPTVVNALLRWVTTGRREYVPTDSPKFELLGWLLLLVISFFYLMTILP